MGRGGAGSVFGADFLGKGRIKNHHKSVSFVAPVGKHYVEGHFLNSIMYVD